MWKAPIGFAVYPRWRGEHKYPGKTRRAACGLSPLARGTLPLLPEPPMKLRFIPAGAGNTPGDVTQYTGGTVYPRWRGEHTLSGLLLSISRGLSPLARGTHFFSVFS